jgi:hypothetical protein
MAFSACPSQSKPAQLNEEQSKRSIFALQPRAYDLLRQPTQQLPRCSFRYRARPAALLLIIWFFDDGQVALLQDGLRLEVHTALLQCYASLKTACSRIFPFAIDDFTVIIKVRWENLAASGSFIASSSCCCIYSTFTFFAPSHMTAPDAAV